ncbi:hypothetical protein Tco_0291758 [Tanacetum coccineum]
MVEGTKNVDELVSSILNSQNDPGTRLDLGSYKESPEVEITTIVQLVNVTEEEEESTEDDYDLSRRVKGKHVEEYRNTPSLTPIRSPRIHSPLISSDTKKFQELTVIDPKPSSHTKPSYSLQPKTGRFKRTKTQVPIYVANGLLMEQKHNQADVAKMIADAIQKEHENLRAEITSQINNAITNHIPSQVDSSVRNYMSDDLQLQRDDLPIWLALKIKFERLTTTNTSCRFFAIRPRDQDNQHDDAHPEGENSAKRQKTFKHGIYVMGESSSDDDELPTENVSQELVEEMSEIVDEAKLRKVEDDYAETGLLWSLSIFIRSTMIWERVNDFQLGVESYQQNVNLTAPTITFPSIEKKKMFSIISKPIYGIIYKNSKKEKRVMGHQEIHKFCDATLKEFWKG